MLRTIVAAVIGTVATTIAGASASTSSFASFSSEQVHNVLNDLYQRGDMVTLEKMAVQAIAENPQGDAA